ncbi:MAG: Beta-barrel assembly-enhancing protease [Candidatus Anoxychlamydiales bacterium]|nr:Beta-barrel assembly-enhancing protease [Candidatus Anoxychlamydiales bacterium]
MPSAPAPLAREPSSAFMPHKKEEVKESIGLYQRIKNVVYYAFLPLIASYNFIHAENLVTKKREFWFLPTSFEKLLGEWYFSSAVNQNNGKCPDREKTQMAKEIFNNLEKHVKRTDLKYKFVVTDSNKVNAFALPQRVAINKGIINAVQKYCERKGYDNNMFKAMVAAVLGHEITHSDARHSARILELLLLLNVVVIGSKIYLSAKNLISNKSQKDERFTSHDLLEILFNFVSNLVVKLYMLLGSRSHEYEADKYGMYMMTKAGYDPEGAIKLQEFFQEKFETPKGWIAKIQEFVSTHPMTAKRLEENKKTLQAIKNDPELKSQIEKIEEAKKAALPAAVGA